MWLVALATSERQRGYIANILNLFLIMEIKERNMNTTYPNPEKGFPSFSSSLHLLMTSVKQINEEIVERLVQSVGTHQASEEVRQDDATLKKNEAKIGLSLPELVKAQSDSIKNE